MDNVRLYDDKTPKPGLLLRCNYYLFYRKNMPAIAIPNTELVPVGAVLLKTVPIRSPNIRYEILQIP